jgi:hypothetical protein
VYISAWAFFRPASQWHSLETFQLVACFRMVELIRFFSSGLGQASAAANNWFWNFIISRFTTQMVLHMKYGIYFFFASLMVLSMVFVFFFVPETSRVPLEYVDRLFETRPVRKANQKVLEEVAHEHSTFRQNLGAEEVSKEDAQFEHKENA